MSKIIESLKKINYKMFLALLLFGLILALYTGFRIFVIGQLSGDYGFSISVQLQWINQIYEIVQEALTFTLFFIIGSTLLNKEEQGNRTKTGSLFTFGIYLVLYIIFIVFAKTLVRLMTTDKLIMAVLVSIKKIENAFLIHITSIVILDALLVFVLNDSYKLNHINFINTSMVDMRKLNLHNLWEVLYA